MINQDIISRRDAISRGMKRYFTGDACHNGHAAERYISGACVECNLERLRARDPEEHRRRQRQFYKGNREALIRRSRKWELDNPESLRARKAKHYVDNREKRLVYFAAHRTKNRDKILEYQRKRSLSDPHRSSVWARANPLKVRAKVAKRRALKKNAKGLGYTVSDVELLLSKQCFRCVNCLKKLRRADKPKGIQFHVDHVTALARGGSNDVRNIQILCPKCNSRKGAKDPFVFALENGRLL